MLKPSHNWRKKVEEIEPEQNKRLVEWINVKDAVPPMGERVLMRFKSGDIVFYDVDRTLTYTENGNPDITCLYKNRVMEYQVTHWMEIEPPKQ